MAGGLVGSERQSMTRRDNWHCFAFRGIREAKNWVRFVETGGGYFIIIFLFFDLLVFVNNSSLVRVFVIHGRGYPRMVLFKLASKKAPCFQGGYAAHAYRER